MESECSGEIFSQEAVEKIIGAAVVAAAAILCAIIDSVIGKSNGS